MIEETIRTIRDRIASFNEQYREILDRSREDLSTLSSAAASLHESASGSWIGSEAGLYYSDFRIPPSPCRFGEGGSAIPGQLPPDWEEKTVDDVVRYVAEQTGGLTLEAISPGVQQAFDEAKRIEGRIENDLLPLQVDERFDDEVANLTFFLDTHRWNVSYEAAVHSRMPKDQVCSETTAVQTGLAVPPHLQYEARILMELIRIKGIADFIENVEEFVRKVDVISRQIPAQWGGPATEIVSGLCDRFHAVSRQLQKRYRGRNPLVINDEHDVRDLLHALLAIHFDEISREEWTPSYADRSSRADLLLEREQIVIETRKSRDDLDAHRLCDELLLDISHYASHPDCRTLICFVYDPEGRIANPRGLEADVARRSTKTVRVVPLIRP